MTRALIVDDNHPLAEDLAEILTQEGYEVVVYSDPELAASDTARLCFDIALLDIRMPKLDGIALQNRLSELHASARYVLMTAHTEDARLATARAQGICDVLTKPVLVHELLQLLDKLAASIARDQGSPGASE